MKERYTIYVRLLDGTEALVPVEASRNENSVFTITKNPFFEHDDVTSVWEFLPGDTVSVLERENQLIASKLLETKVPNRDAYELIYRIVLSIGTLKIQNEFEMKQAIDALRNRSEMFPQRDHPLVKRWLSDLDQTDVD